MLKITSKVYDNIDQIARKDWDAVFGDIPESYAFYKISENSRLGGFKFYYLVIYFNQEVIFIAPLFSVDFNLDIAVEGWLVKVINSIRKAFPRFLIVHTLFCGSALGEYGALGIRPDFKDDSRLIPLLLAGMQDLAVRINAPLTIFKDFLKPDTLFLDILTQKGYAKMEGFPSVGLELNFASFEDYLKSLGSSTRKNLNKKLKQAYSRGKIEVKITSDVREEIDQVIKLYENTYYRGITRFERLTKEFFLGVAEDLSVHTRFFFYYVDGKLAAFNLCFLYPNLLIDKFVGFDYDMSKRCNLYFVSWAQNIKFCLDNSLRYYYPGKSNYEPKIRLGGRLIILYAYLKHRNVFFNFLLKLFILTLKPHNFDKNIKNKTDV